MKDNNQILSQLKKHPVYSFCLIASVLFFVYKGVLYAIIGSYVPLVVIAIILLLFGYAVNKSHTAFRRTIAFWSILLILWSGSRLLLSIVNQFIKPIPEAHVHAQLGLTGSLLSLAFLFAAIYLLRKKRQF